ncbi:NAD(P)-binding protein [Serendipita vermifera]|nr:NAD(P)-binding protein [Serendipita vermifera]
MSFLPVSFRNYVEQYPYLSAAITCLTFSFTVSTFFVGLGNARQKKVPPAAERVLIVGGSSGLGRKLAVLYAQRGAKVCVTGRRKALLEELQDELLKLYPPVVKTSGGPCHVLIEGADMTRPEDLVRVRDNLQQEWGGVDTVLICAGVSSLRPLLDIANSPHGTRETTLENIQHVGEIAQKAIDGNFTGPLLTAVTFIPQLQSTSPSPSVLLVSSVAALIPAPTRSLYCASKASSLMLFRALAIEHPKVSFSHICPGTIEGNFRASAVDGGDVREVLEGALKSEYVAKQCIKMVDNSKDMLVLPFKYYLGMWMSWIAPSFVNWRARVKYGFTNA